MRHFLFFSFFQLNIFYALCSPLYNPFLEFFLNCNIFSCDYFWAVWCKKKKIVSIKLFYVKSLIVLCVSVGRWLAHGLEGVSLVSEERYFSQRRFPRKLHPEGLRFTPHAKSAIHTISSDILSETKEVIYVSTYTPKCINKTWLGAKVCI